MSSVAASVEIKCTEEARTIPALINGFAGSDSRPSPESSRTECAQEYHEICPDTITESRDFSRVSVVFKASASCQSSHVLFSHYKQAAA
jgi:hypothetical protein